MTLSLEHLSAGYGGGTTVHRVSLTVAAGSVHTLIGHNGAGKTTLLHAMAGLIRPTTGRVQLGGRDLTRRPVHARARAGIGYVPQGARVFASLTVAEHLALAQRRRPPVVDAATPTWTRQRVLDLLPQLQRRLRHRGGHLSGGEQQMLALARALLTQPSVLLLDEPTEGLAPGLAAQIRDTITALATTGLSILLATPQPDLAVALASHHISVLTAGRISGLLDAGTVRADPDRLHAALIPAVAAISTSTTVRSRLAPGPGRPAWADTLPDPEAAITSVTATHLVNTGGNP